jgi:hypothetical protein
VGRDVLRTVHLGTRPIVQIVKVSAEMVSLESLLEPGRSIEIPIAALPSLTVTLTGVDQLAVDPLRAKLRAGTSSNSPRKI